MRSLTSWSLIASVVACSDAPASQPDAAISSDGASDATVAAEDAGADAAVDAVAIEKCRRHDGTLSSRMVTGPECTHSTTMPQTCGRPTYYPAEGGPPSKGEVDMQRFEPGPSSFAFFATAFITAADGTVICADYSGVMQQDASGQTHFDDVARPFRACSAGAVWEDCFASTVVPSHCHALSERSLVHVTATIDPATQLAQGSYNGEICGWP